MAVINAIELATANSALAKYFWVRLGALTYSLLLLEKVMIRKIGMPSSQKSFKQL